MKNIKEKILVCSHCKTEITLEQVFCPTCGNELTFKDDKENVLINPQVKTPYKYDKFPQDVFLQTQRKNKKLTAKKPTYLLNISSVLNYLVSGIFGLIFMENLYYNNIGIAFIILIIIPLIILLDYNLKQFNDSARLMLVIFYFSISFISIFNLPFYIITLIPGISQIYILSFDEKTVSVFRSKYNISQK